MINYQLTKTLRFGLTKVRKEKKHLSHEELDDLVMVSEYNLIKKNVLELADKTKIGNSNYDFGELDKRFEEIIKIEDRDQRNAEYVAFLNEFFKDKSPVLDLNPEQTLFDKIKGIKEDIDRYINAWEQVCTKTHLIKISKDYYKNLSKKAFYEIAKIATPEIPLSSLRGKNNYGVTVVKAISDYWLKTIRKASFFFNDFFKSEFEEMGNALNDKSSNHKKKNLVDFRKSFLSLCSLVDDSLSQLVNGSILINGSSNEGDKKVIDDFISNASINKRVELYDKIREIRDLIKTEGGNTLLGRATLNPYTALQKPNLFSEKLKEKDLSDFMEQLIQFLQSDNCKDKSSNTDVYKILFAEGIDKKSQMNDEQKSAVQRAQYFKFKQVPASVRFGLANYLSEKHSDVFDLKKIYSLFRIIGVPVSPAEDYKDKKGKGEESEFSLDNYPLKVAFDYAWELCAKNLYENVDFPQQECERFLKENFDIDIAKIDSNKTINVNLYQVKSDIIKSLFAMIYKDKVDAKWESIYYNLKDINSFKNDVNNIKNFIPLFPAKSKDQFRDWVKKYPECKKNFDNIKKSINLQLASQDLEFLWYSKLLWLNSSIVTLEHFSEMPPSNAVIEEILEKIDDIFLNENVVLTKEQSENITIIKNWIVEYKTQSDKKDWINGKKWSDKRYEDAKIFFGKQRGDQKTEFLKKTIVGDKDITEKFKDIAIEFGKNFAAIRDGLREEYELNKIQYGSVIIEDKNGERYLLLQDKNVNKTDKGEKTHLDIFKPEASGDIKLFYVKSLTSKTVKKIVASKKNYGSFFVDNDGNEITYPDKKDNKYKVDSKRCNSKEQIAQEKEQKRLQYDKDLMISIVNSLTKSKFSHDENLTEFGWDNLLNQCCSLEQLYKTIDQKGYLLVEDSINYASLKELIEDKSKDRDKGKDKGCFLLPIVNQNITADPNKTKANPNQFTKDWNLIFDMSKKDYRLHPEFTLFYRLPTPNYPKPSEKRYSRFQVNCNFGLEVIPYECEYTNKKEQLESFKTPSIQKDNVAKFNNELSVNEPYVIGIDRGINELATLCVTDFSGKIIGDFDIYKREFDDVNKCQKYTPIKNKRNDSDGEFEKRNILDLTTLRVERDVNGKSYLVDLSESKVWIDSLNHDLGQRDNKLMTQLKELYYTRQFVYHLQSKPDEIINEFNRLKQEKNDFDSTNTNSNGYFKFESELIIPFKCGNAFAHYPFEAIDEIIAKYNELKAEGKQDDIRKFYELDASYELKKGIVANMIGVVIYIFKEICHSNARIVLENLCTAWRVQNNALTGAQLPSTLVDFKDQENERLAGVGTYSLFEIQLLKKLFKLQIEDGKNYVPAFRSVDDYEKAIQKLAKKKGDKKPTIYQFGIICFVSPTNTSHKCPICGASGKKIIRHKESNDELECTNCGYYSIVGKITRKSLFNGNRFVNDEIDNFYKDSNLKVIESGDDNAAYQIAVKVLKYFSDEKDEDSFFSRIQRLQRKLNKDLDNDEKDADVIEVSEETSAAERKPQKNKKNGFNKQSNYNNKNRNNNRKRY